MEIGKIIFPSNLLRMCFILQMIIQCNGNKVRYKRDLLDFENAIKCATGKDGFRNFNGYGCWCGLGGKGRPVDAIDTCCYYHDECYKRTRTDGFCGLIGRYTTDYRWSCKDINSTAVANASLSYMARMAIHHSNDGRLKGVPLCNHETGNACGNAICQCDVDAAMCFTLYPYPDVKPGCPLSALEEYHS